MKMLITPLFSILFLFTVNYNIKAEVYTTSSAADKNGNVTIVGYCFGKLSFYGINEDVVTRSGIIIRLNSEGEMLWYKIIQSSIRSFVNSVGVDAFGNSYVTGGISGIAVFDTIIITSTGIDAFVSKYDSEGNVIWVRQGASPSTVYGKDIWVDSLGNSFTIGDGTNILFDSLQIGSPAFIVKINPNGEIILLRNPMGITLVNSLVVDSENNIVYSGTYPGPYPVRFSRIAKIDSSGNLIWMQDDSAIQMTTDKNSNIYAISSAYINNSYDIYLRKFDFNGTTILTSSHGGSGTDIGLDIFLDQNSNVFITGEYSGSFQFGTVTLTSFGYNDGFIAKLDSNFNVIWVKSGGGLTNDQLKNVSISSDGSIYASGNFKGEITLGNTQTNGGTSEVSNWIAAIKFNQEGDIIWIKKVVETVPLPNQGNWFPLEKGNRWRFFESLTGFTWRYNLKDMLITDSLFISGKKFFNVSGHILSNYSIDFPPLLIRYDNEAGQIKTYLNSHEYTYMDFSLSNGEEFDQIQPNGTFRTMQVTSANLNLFNQSIVTKGFTFDFGAIDGLILFAEDIGCVFVKEHGDNSPWNPDYNRKFDLTEFTLYDSGGAIHLKHNYHANIQFESVIYLPDTLTNITQNFLIDHHYSVKSSPPGVFGFSYIDSTKLESYYSDGTDIIYNTPHHIIPITEKDFYLSFPIDTNLYNQGYYLFYRIAVKDKGIIPSYYYQPEEGYYKLYWGDSVSTIVQIENFSYDYSLAQNYPNPFNPKTNIEFSIKEKTEVVLKIYDILGNEMKTLINEEISPGKYKIDFSAEGLSSGIYIYQLRTGDFIKSKKMTFIK
jgi:hypothetical protein